MSQKVKMYFTFHPMTISFLNGNSLITVNTARVIPMNSVLKCSLRWLIKNGVFQIQINFITMVYYIIELTSMTILPLNVL